ncbi:hypothetical protein AB205_0149050 [Aquarana catesbeiana]|uniref:Uncharacterized protein n=1 Tax=Aquarana catesbeiana TaxID=8400 RepID=A0A2G9RZ51_AQUCT|nr:hypothetical protein AB205_0149050 [Aquarana catesbeiana]
MANRRYISEEAYTFLSMTDSEEEVTHLSDSGSEYEPVDSSGSMTNSSDDGVVVPAKRSTSTAISSGELASTSGLVHPGHTSCTAVTLDDVASPISAV